MPETWPGPGAHPSLLALDPSFRHSIRVRQIFPFEDRKLSDVDAEAGDVWGRRAFQVAARRWRRAVCRKNPRGGKRRRGVQNPAEIPSDLALVGDVPRRGPRDGKESNERRQSGDGRRVYCIGRGLLPPFLSFQEETSSSTEELKGPECT